MVYRKKFRQRAKSGTGGMPKVFGKHGLHHEFGTSGLLHIDVGTTKGAVMIPLAACDSTLANPDSIYVNPRNSSKTTSNDHLTYGSSVVRRAYQHIKLWQNPGMTNVAGDPLFKTRMYCCPILMNYDDLTKESGGETPATYLPVVEHGSDEKLVPNYNNLAVDSQKSNFYDGDNLTTATVFEHVSFDPHAFETALAESPISKLLRSITAGGLRSFDLHREHPIDFGQMVRLPKKVQLQTEHTFWAVILGVWDEDDEEQYYTAAQRNSSDQDVGFAIEQSNYEWNKEFNQNVS